MNKPICKECEKENKRYSVEVPMSGMRTLISFTPGHWDEDGNFVQHNDPNTTVYSYRCSNGHVWKEIN